MRIKLVDNRGGKEVADILSSQLEQFPLFLYCMIIPFSHRSVVWNGQTDKSIKFTKKKTRKKFSCVAVQIFWRSGA